MSLGRFTRFDSLLLREEPLAKYTAARLGGPAERLYLARDSEAALVDLLRAAWAEGVPVTILGGGANVLVADAGVRGLVIVNHSGSIHIEGGAVTAGGGVGLTVLARRCAARGLAGFEWAASVPGTVGGAVVNNAGAHGGDMAGNIESIRLLEPSGERVLTGADLAYGYRSSSLKTRPDRRFLVLSAALRLTPDDPAAITARMVAFSAYRKRTQPPGASLGSIFKNPPGDYAGRLIEAAGLKGFSIGGAQVSPIHANFFINAGNASAADYRALVDHVRAAVAAHSGVLLETEIEFIG